jgi:hypothetical protein
MPFQESLVFIAGEPTAAIRVKNDRTSILSLPQRHQDGLQHELAVLVGTHRPTDDSSRVEIHHDAEIEPSFGSSDVSDVGNPFRVGMVRAEVSSQVILNVIRSSARRLLPPATPLRDAAKGVVAHQASHAVAAAWLAQVTQLLTHSRTSEDAIALRMQASDASEQSNIRLLAPACWTLSPTVVAAG